MNVHSSALTNSIAKETWTWNGTVKPNFQKRQIIMITVIDPEKRTAENILQPMPCRMNATERGEVKIRVSLWCGGRLIKLNSSSGQGSSSIDCVADQDSSEDKVNRPWTDKKHFNSRWGAFDPMQSWRTSVACSKCVNPPQRSSGIHRHGWPNDEEADGHERLHQNLSWDARENIIGSQKQRLQTPQLETYHSRSEQEFTIPCHWQMVNELTTDRPITTICSRSCDIEIRQQKWHYWGLQRSNERLGGHGSREPEIGSPQLIYGFNVASKFV